MWTDGYKVIKSRDGYSKLKSAPESKKQTNSCPYGNFCKKNLNESHQQSTLKDFYEKHSDSKDQLLTWHKVATKANWKNFLEIKKYFNSVDCIQDFLMVFNIKGNKYRLVVDFNFKFQWAFIVFIGTHNEYTKRIF